MKKVTGIGGVFFKSKDPKKISDWYGKNLGLVINPYGSVFEFRQGADPAKKGYTVWSPFKEDSDYFSPSKDDFMVNYRVDDLNSLLEELRSNGVKVVGEIEEFEYGKFAHIMDPEGRKIELWEPIDDVFTKEYEGKSTM
jgi:predicted enzyme related to lactoylglutathione lyase